MESLISRSQPPNSEGMIQKITPESAGWKYVGFEVFKLKSISRNIFLNKK